jgi:hypothetical protein
MYPVTVSDVDVICAEVQVPGEKTGVNKIDIHKGIENTYTRM